MPAEVHPVHTLIGWLRLILFVVTAGVEALKGGYLQGCPWKVEKGLVVLCIGESVSSLDLSRLMDRNKKKKKI